ncbi:MAG: DUF3387 domain-containing protein, partial [Myxococcales bacterium]|nr:DUF3387 domain-containing protein [Myxococcales bacterium]
VELLRKLLNDEVKALGKRNVVQSKKFSEMLEKTLNQYQNRSLTSAEIIQQLIQMAKDMREARERGNTLGLTEDELAFYDALADHGDVKELMGDDVLSAIAQDLVKAIQASVTIDWTQKEAVRADMRRKVKRLLRKHGYPPDKREEAVITVLQQAEAVCRDWAENPPAATGRLLPFRRVPLDEARPFENCVPALDLQVAAGGWSPAQLVQDGTRHYDWVALEGRTRPGKDLFVAQVIGESMNRRIPNGAWCVWRLNPGCDGRSGTEIVLAQHRDIQDADTGGKYTVKLYRREIGAVRGEAERVILSPASTDASFQPIVLEGLVEGELVIVAELVEVLQQPAG